MPVLFNVMRSAEDYLREFLCQQLTVLATYLRQHIRKYLPDILAIVHEFWVPSSHLLPYILKLVSELASTLCFVWVGCWCVGGGVVVVCLPCVVCLVHTTTYTHTHTRVQLR